MNKQIARVNWSRGRYSDVVRSTIVDPSPLKQGQKVRVIWGKGKREYAATITCYPLIEEIELPVDEPQPRQTKAKRKLIPEATSSAERRKKTKTDKPKPKEKPKGKVLDAASPSKVYESIEDTSDDSSDGEDFPLVAYNPQRKMRDSEKPVQETPEEMPHFLESEEESDNINFGSLLSKAIRTVDNSTAIISTGKNSSSNKQDQTVNELRFVRTILERLECSYAKQEAKLDRLLSLVTTQPFRASQCSTTGTPELPYTPPVRFRQEPAADKSDLHRTPCMTEPDQVLDELIRQTDFDSAEKIKVGGAEEVQLAKVDFDFAKAATKPTVMALRLVDKLFSKEILMNSTVHGTKDFAPLDHRIITSIKAEVTRSFGYQCRDREEITRMWESCKISIGKRCQNLRKNSDKQTRQD